MQEKIHAAQTLVYPSSDGEPMAETERHRKALTDLIDILDKHFQHVPDVHVSGNLLIYYEEGNPRKSVSPDVFMVHGVSKKELRTYKTWEQQPTLDFVLELASPSTFARDFNEKKEIYAKILKVKEYYIYDPYGEIDPHFVGFRLVGEEYQEIAFVDGRIPSAVLGLDLGERDGVLRMYNPVPAEWLYPSRERLDQAEARAAQEIRARQDAEARAAQEIRARQDAEAELAKVRAALERLQVSE